MDEKCHKAQDVDLALFLIDPHSSEWQEFRTHYPCCVTCSAEVQQWTSLELGLRTLGNVGTNGHPSAETLVAFQQKSSRFTHEEQHQVEAHLRSCVVCRDEVNLLGSFDISRIQHWQREAQTTNATVVTSDSWATRAWDTLRSLFLHPAFAFGVVLLLSVPFIRSYYSASVNNIPSSSEVASTPIGRQVPSEQANKEKVSPTKLAKQSAPREDFPLKDERIVPPPSASPAPTAAGSGGARDAEISAQQQRSKEEKERRQTSESPPVAAAVMEREARSTEGLSAPRERMEKGDASQFSSTTSAPPQAAALARGNLLAPESHYRTTLSSLLETYKHAYEARDVNALGKVWRMNQSWRDALTQLFAQSQRIALLLGLDEEQLTASADERQLSVPLSQTLTTVNQEGRTVQHAPFFCVADIRQQPTGAWIIHELQDDPQHSGQCRLP